MDGGQELLRGAVAELAGRVAALTDDTRDESWTPIVASFDDASSLTDDQRLVTMIESTGLDHVDLSLLLAAAATSLDHRFSTLFAGLSGRHDDGRPTVDLLMVINGLSPWDPVARARFGPTGPLVRCGLIDADGLDRVDRTSATLLAAPVAVPERVVAWLLGDDRPDARLVALLAPTAGLATDAVIRACRAMQAGLWNIWIREGAGGGSSVGASALATLGATSLVLDLRRLPSSLTFGEVLSLAWREASLTGGGVVVGPVDPQRDAAVLATLPLHPARPTLLVSTSGWDPTRSGALPVEVDVPPLSLPERAAIWDTALTELDVDADGTSVELATLRLAPEQIRLAALSAVGAAAATDEPVALHHFRSAALAHGSNRLTDLAQRVQPEATFDDLVVDADLRAELTSLPGRHRTRHVVRDDWGLGRGGGRGVGLTCLFAGPSGTGKTLAAEVVANAVGVDLFVIDLSQIVDKYIGETEKNLERVFTEAESVNGVLLFDEADALFGKRSDVQSSHDRHANVEVAYLLQRMERYDGIAILTTNLRGNIDEAFLRRLDVVCSFVEPDAVARRELWCKHLPPRLPLADDVDLDALAEHLAISGGTIRNITLTAAHTAAIGPREVTMADLVTASVREYRKMGRLFNRPELSTWMTPSE